ncbi:MAG: ABC transporter ATP-binding protein [Ramlibacter sp.]
MNTRRADISVAHATALRFSWPGQVPLFDALSFALPPGVSWLGGDEGAGKTTLLRLLAGELSPQAGALQVHGTVFWVNPRADGCDALTPSQCFERLAQQHPALDRALLADLAAELDLEQHMTKRLDMLSTGSRRKVWLAAAFAAGATLTLLDQPFAALDKPSARFITELLHEAAADPRRGWVVADHVAPAGVPLACAWTLGA